MDGQLVTNCFNFYVLLCPPISVIHFFSLPNIFQIQVVVALMICLIPPPSFLVLEEVNHLPLNHPLIIHLEMYIVHYNLLLHSLRYGIHFCTVITIDIYDLRNHPHKYCNYYRHLRPEEPSS